MAIEPEYEEQDEREFDIGDDDEALEVPQEAADDLVVEEADESQDKATPEPESEPEPEQEEERPKRAGRLQQRLENLARRAADAEAALERERHQRVQYENQLAAERVAQVGQMENSLKTELASAKREFIDAKTVGDYNAEAEATTRIAKLSADISAVEAYRAQNSQSRQEEERQQQPRQQPRQQAQVAPETAAWVAANSWFVPNTPEYDEELAAEAQHFARKMEIRLKREGKADQIGSREYFAIIDEHIRGEFPDAFEDAPKPNARAKTPPMKSDSSVAPVARQNAPLQPKPKTGKLVKLSREQREFAEQMRPNMPREKAWAEYARYL